MRVSLTQRSVANYTTVLISSKRCQVYGHWMTSSIDVTFPAGPSSPMAMDFA